MIRSGALSYFSRLSRLPLTLSEKIRLFNSQLIPAVTDPAYSCQPSPPPPPGPLPRCRTSSGEAWQRGP